ncbi:efflux RND transporter permease subunit [Marinicella gelatinilytica]|uniref:efflux RND transporter permease subunit n=1 Tax=Marinicella gelatinilytica TaxID=2996017 RepID=UPI002260844C|nr:efflux RND transporter permease subunit [Marinicella gelatinilytica]MCX7545463.1 efflux RND transporter permease subunit [Marinicella gelatinilytica]
MNNQHKLSISGVLAKYFQNNQLTPLIALVLVLLGAFAVVVTPREEEPQIDVTFANVIIGLPGASAKEVEQLITIPAEQVLDELSDIKHIYSISRPGMSIITVRFKVGIKRNDAIVRLYNQVQSNSDWLPYNLGATTPVIKPMGIDDVPVLTATLWSDDPNKTNADLLKIAHSLENQLKRIPETRIIRSFSGGEQIVHIEMNPVDMLNYKVGFTDITHALQASNYSLPLAKRIEDNRLIQVQTGYSFSHVDDLKSLIVKVTAEGKPVYLQDIAKIHDGADSPESYTWIHSGHAWGQGLAPDYAPAVTIAVGKKPGSNAGQITQSVIQSLEQLKLSHIPDDVHVEITRDYGQTANDKANQLIKKLIFATISVIILMLIAMGWRQALVVGLAVSITLAITLFASWAYGFTLNRVSLFALIFSIGILVDDAVVVVENIHRRSKNNKDKLSDIIPPAVNEVGGPTILATFTVIAALMPMAFVSGLMGPYMSPIPINASMGMLLSLLIALIVTPWLYIKIIGKGHSHSEKHTDENEQPKKDSIFQRILPVFLKREGGRKPRYALIGSVVLLLILSIMLVPFQQVILKMLPFDDKSELQIIVDMKEGTTLETTNQLMVELVTQLNEFEEVKHAVAYTGMSSPINFNGLVRQYFLRQGSHLGDIQIMLTDKYDRDKQSHQIALEMREILHAMAQKYDASLKIVEVPPGPPVISPLVAEVYGNHYPDQIAATKDIEKLFHEVDHLVDIDTTIEFDAPKQVLEINLAKAMLAGISQQQIINTVNTALVGSDVSFLRDEHNKYAQPIRIEIDRGKQNDLTQLMTVPIKSNQGHFIQLGELVTMQNTTIEKSIQHKDLRPMTMVTADIAGGADSPLYGMFGVKKLIEEQHPEIDQYFIEQPLFTDNTYIKWDGEWQITYETFRDMGIAYSVGLILIFLLIVAHFHSYFAPLIIMAPIPLTIIGILPGHWLLGAQFTATSMIGMIALAGIIVRNSILLVDFILIQLAAGADLKTAVIQSAEVRAKPIILTALAAMMGAFFILDDPIFNGLAVSLIFGILISTLLTLVVIPVLFYWYQSRQDNKAAAAA